MTEDQYTALVEKWGKTKRKGKKNPYTSHNGHMFSFFDTKENFMAIRLSPADLETFGENYNTSPVQQYGAVMKGYVKVSSDLFGDQEQLMSWLDRSYSYINSLKPK